MLVALEMPSNAEEMRSTSFSGSSLPAATMDSSCGMSRAARPWEPRKWAQPWPGTGGWAGSRMGFLRKRLGLATSSALVLGHVPYTPSLKPKRYASEGKEWHQVPFLIEIQCLLPFQLGT